MIDLINLEVPTQEEEVKRLLAMIPDQFYKEEGSIFHDVLSIVANDNIEKLKLMKNIFINSFGITATGEFLDHKVAEVGMERKSGEKAKGIVKFMGAQGTRISHNTIVLCDNLEYATLIDSEIGVEGNVSIEVVATEIGRNYNIKGNMINKLGTTINGVSNVTNENDFKGGEDVETDSELRARYLEKVREPATSGNVYDYKRWATSINGIGQAKVYPLHAGPGTVKVVVISNLGRTVENEKIEEVKRYIDNLKPIGATVTVANATPLNINFTARISKSELVDIETIKEEFKVKLNEYITNVNLNNGSISYGRVSAILYGLKGLIDFNDLRINNGTNGVSIPGESIAVLGTVNLNV
ncbi:baseplate J/gp47 family protein [Streptobacillus canis]|uniref:baseplate J/gp47 family protein n=1 Tax=Streptobacillus canis TaxID=2678686 RepID=UPI0012E253FF|nr:baseplate J/gp47 family protein [Streptobacillus canis]